MLASTEERYQAIILRAEDIARTHTDEMVSIKFLCRACKVSERTLRQVFWAVHSNTPYRHLRDMRLREARNALLHPRSPVTTVTLVATQFGFLELGQFSVAYRSAFGECPSVTLRRARQEAKMQHAG